MKDFKASFLALSEDVDINISSINDIDLIIGQFMMIFAHDKAKKSINALQQNTEKIKKDINLFVQAYKIVNPKIQRLNTYFKRLKENEYFFFLPCLAVSEEQRCIFYIYLSAMANNEDFDKQNQEFERFFAPLYKNYDIAVFNERTKKKIGEPDKSKRKCRFCGRNSDKTTFKKVAHSISEALGNKRIITNDECDECNERFGKGIENDLILFLNPYRTFFGVKGKNGIPKLKGKNFEIENKGTISIKQYLTDEEMNDPYRDDLKFRFDTTQKITYQNIYKTLSKYALSVIDSSSLTHFSKTVEWINGNRNIDKLPKLARLESCDLYLNHPLIMVYLRKSNDFNLPYAVAEFRFLCSTFVYIIPNSSNDNFDFSDNDNYDKFREFFKHYNFEKNWEFLSMNDNTARTFVINLNFEEYKK